MTDVETFVLPRTLSFRRIPFSLDHTRTFNNGFDAWIIRVMVHE